jgi:hypothetical protein
VSLTSFHPLWDKDLSQNLHAVADQGCHPEGSLSGNAYRGESCNPILGALHSACVSLRTIVFPAIKICSSAELSFNRSSGVSGITEYNEKMQSTIGLG